MLIRLRPFPGYRPFEAACLWEIEDTAGVYGAGWDDKVLELSGW